MHAIDVFLSYHRPDAELVREIRGFLEQQGLVTFFDSQDLATGLPWPHSLENALALARSVAVFLGPHGIGKWQKREIAFALDRQVAEEGSEDPLPVIPVLLPGARLVQAFLFLNSWVDLRHSAEDRDGLTSLLSAIRGQAQTAMLAKDSPCPFRGLTAFREEDAGLFFGREQFTKDLLNAVLKRDTVVLVGPSGSGKSSVIHAGLIPQLRKRRPPNDSWDALSFTPGDAPFHRFAASAMPLLDPELSVVDRMKQSRQLGDALESGSILAEDVFQQVLDTSGGTGRFLVILDQFEELFTLNRPKERAKFIDAFLDAFEASSACWLISMRADFYGHALESSRRLSDKMNAGVINLGPMTSEELRQVIEAPARRAGLQLESGLVSTILEDVDAEPGGLPLLEFALTELWANRNGHRLTHEGYERVGRVDKAVANRAEAVYGRFAETDKRIVRDIFTRLVRVASPDEGGSDTRRRARESELNGGGNADKFNVADVIDALVEARLLVKAREDASGETTIEVAHEALIRNWERLRNWLDEDREFYLWRQGLRYTIQSWRRLDRDQGMLLRGAQLDEAVRWSASQRHDLKDVECQFIDLSVQEKAAEVGRAESESQLRRVEQELNVVGRVQKELFPREAPGIVGFDIAGTCVAAQHVSGDYYDFIPMQDGSLGIAVADVAGHGLGPSIIMVGLRAFLRALAMTRSDVAGITDLANRFLSEDIGDGKFVTLFLAKLDAQSRSIAYCGSGMDAHLVRASGETIHLPATGMPIGIVEDAHHQESRLPLLHEGDLLLIATDGVFEARSPSEELFGIGKIIDIVAKNRHKTSHEIVESILQALTEFTGGRSYDDMTIVVIKRYGIGEV